MVVKLADNIYSPLGVTTRANYDAVMEGRCALRQYALPDGSLYTASLFPDAERRDDDHYTFFEQLCIASASDALTRADVDPRSPDVRFFLSTTKGNVHLLRAEGEVDERVLLGASARVICRFFGNPNPPVVVSNACISGLSAQIVAVRSLEAGYCTTAVVIGCDVQSDFIISGFQSLHALSPDECRPFDRDRCGLNLGEAAATIVYSGQCPVVSGQWVVRGGAMCNDANHISGPSRTGEGSYRCLQALNLRTDELAFVSVHGTSTLYNDEMESIALERAGLSSVPVFSLKGVYGHTMGAAGVLETILSMKAVEHGVVFGTRGFENKGVTGDVLVSAEPRKTDKQNFVKLLSGFGGCNAAMLFEKFRECKGVQESAMKSRECSEWPVVSLRLEMRTEELVEMYRSHIGDYPKFFKMDPLSRLGFVASELLLKKVASEADGQLNTEHLTLNTEFGVLLFNRSGSLADDRAYVATTEGEDRFPSPSLFVYTLPNIVTGEIAIRNHFLTETNFIVLEKLDEEVMAEQIALAAERGPQIAGWCEVDATGQCSAMLLAVPQHISKERILRELRVKN